MTAAAADDDASRNQNKMSTAANTNQARNTTRDADRRRPVQLRERDVRMTS